MSGLRVFMADGVSAAGLLRVIRRRQDRSSGCLRAAPQCPYSKALPDRPERPDRDRPDRAPIWRRPGGDPHMDSDLPLCQPARPPPTGNAGAQLFGMNHVARNSFVTKLGGAAMVRRSPLRAGLRVMGSRCEPIAPPYPAVAGKGRVGCAMIPS